MWNVRCIISNHFENCVNFKHPEKSQEGMENTNNWEEWRRHGQHQELACTTFKIHNWFDLSQLQAHCQFVIGIYQLSFFNATTFQFSRRLTMRLFHMQLCMVHWRNPFGPLLLLIQARQLQLKLKKNNIIWQSHSI